MTYCVHILGIQLTNTHNVFHGNETAHHGTMVRNAIRLAIYAAKENGTGDDERLSTTILHLWFVDSWRNLKFRVKTR